MAGAAYYNEIDPYAADWLRNLIAAGHIAPGDVDERSIEDVHPDDLRGYTQCHFFAGIGVWSYALRRAGWPDDRPVWTGSCPCQPFSAAGKGAAFDDERHLWPDWHWLIQECHPPVVFGEQVESRDGLGWLDLVQADLEGLEYACGAVVTLLRATALRTDAGGFTSWPTPTVNDSRGGRNKTSGRSNPDSKHHDGTTLCDAAIFAAWATPKASDGSGGRTTKTKGGGNVHFGPAGAVGGFWSNAEWIYCADRGGVWRPVEPGTFPLVDGAAARVGRLRAYGNAINAVQAQIFIEECMRCI